MADGKKPQKGGKRPEINTAFEIPEDIYAGYCTPPEEDKNQRKVRIQKIERRWAREWRVLGNVVISKISYAHARSW